MPVFDPVRAGRSLSRLHVATRARPRGT